MSNLIIANGRLHHDKNIGNFTYCSQTGLSTVDYLLLHPNDIQFLDDFNVLEFNEFSDHSPLYFTFQLKQSITRGIHHGNHEQQSSNQIRFNEAKIPLFRTQLMNNNEVLNGLTNSGCV